MTKYILLALMIPTFLTAETLNEKWLNETRKELSARGLNKIIIATGNFIQALYEGNREEAEKQLKFDFANATQINTIFSQTKKYVDAKKLKVEKIELIAYKYISNTVTAGLYVLNTNRGPFYFMITTYVYKQELYVDSLSSYRSTTAALDQLQKLTKLKAVVTMNVSKESKSNNEIQ